jgi:hypothetical protein
MLPQTKEEQTAIAQVLQAVDKEIILLKAKAEKLGEQKKGGDAGVTHGKKTIINMSEFSFNHSVIDEKYNILINQELINAVRAQARVILLPFFRKISIQYIMSENEKEYPVLTELCERIIRNVFVRKVR